MGLKYRFRTRTKKGGSVRIPLTWFVPEEYPQILEIANHPEGMTRDFGRWHEVAQNQERDLKRRGFFPVRVIVHPDEFVAWCSAKGIQPSGDSLKSFTVDRTPPSV